MSYRACIALASIRIYRVRQSVLTRRSFPIQELKSQSKSHNQIATTYLTANAFQIGISSTPQTHPSVRSFLSSLRNNPATLQNIPTPTTKASPLLHNQKLNHMLPTCDILHRSTTPRTPSIPPIVRSIASASSNLDRTPAEDVDRVSDSVLRVLCPGFGGQGERRGCVGAEKGCVGEREVKAGVGVEEELCSVDFLLQFWQGFVKNL